jgi:DNA repair exonuclease SbcCD ATPase subunit
MTTNCEVVARVADQEDANMHEENSSADMSCENSLAGSDCVPVSGAEVSESKMDCVSDESTEQRDLPDTNSQFMKLDAALIQQDIYNEEHALEIKALKVENDDLKQRVIELEAKLKADTETAKSIIKRQIDIEKKKVVAELKKREELQNKLNGTEQKLKKVNDDLQNAKQEVTQQNEKLKGQDKTIQEGRNDNDKLKKGLQKANNTIEKAKEFVKNLKKEKSVSETELKTAKENIKKQEDQIMLLNKDVKDKTSEIQSEKAAKESKELELDVADKRIAALTEELTKSKQSTSEKNQAYNQLEQEKKKIESELIQLRCSMNSVSQLERGGKPLTSTTVKDDFIDLRDQVLLELSNEVGDLGDLSGDKMDELLEKMYEEAFFKFWENVAEIKSDDRIQLRKNVQSMTKDMERELEEKMYMRLIQISIEYANNLSDVDDAIKDAAKLVVKFNLDMTIPEPAILLFNATVGDYYDPEKHKNKNIKVTGSQIAHAISPGMKTVLGKIMDPAAVFLK